VAVVVTEEEEVEEEEEEEEEVGDKSFALRIESHDRSDRRSKGLIICPRGRDK